MSMDLTKIDKPLGELDDETATALFLAWRKGKTIESKWEGDADNFNACGRPDWHLNRIYRVKPEPLRDISLPWEVIDEKWKWAVRDRGGEVWMYDGKPAFDEFRWFCGDVNDDAIEFPYFIKHDPGNKPWKESLIKRPEGGLQ